jgi:proton-translocating NADH-quinone oxidoreductase chain N
LKMSVVPFHMWIPDTYEGSPTTVSALLSAGTKKAGFVVAIRVFLVALPLFSVSWTMAFAVLAVLTMTLGNIAALTQRIFTRMLAYSSIAQAGYILIGLAVASPLGLAGALFHVLNHAVMQSAAFIAAAAVVHRTTRADLERYGGLWKKMPVTAFTLAVSLFALAGVPPLNGFWSKLILFTAAIEGGLVWLAVAGVLNSALSLGYYAWVVKRMYLDDAEDSIKVAEPVSFTLVLIIATVIIIATGLFPAIIYDFAEKAVQGFCFVQRCMGL